jgi:hypothetical protein
MIFSGYPYLREKTRTAAVSRKRHEPQGADPSPPRPLKVHKIEIFFGFDFEICIMSLLVM